MCSSDLTDSGIAILLSGEKYVWGAYFINTSTTTTQRIGFPGGAGDIVIPANQTVWTWQAISTTESSSGSLRMELRTAPVTDGKVYMVGGFFARGEFDISTPPDSFGLNDQDVFYKGQWLTEDNAVVNHRSSLDEVEHTLNKNTNVTQSSGVARRLTRGMLSASIRDGDVITYDDSFLSTPEVLFIPAGISFNPVDLSAIKEHALSFTPVGAAPSGFTASLKIQELASTIIPQTLSPFAAGATYDEEITKAASAEAWDDSYTIQYDVTVNGAGAPLDPVWVQGRVDIYYDSGAGWVLKDSINYSHTSTGSSKTWPNERKTYNIGGMGTGSKFAVDYVADPWAGSVSGDQVEYDTATAPLTHTATKTGAPSITAIILENKDTGLVIT